MDARPREADLPRVAEGRRPAGGAATIATGRVHEIRRLPAWRYGGVGQCRVAVGQAEAVDRARCQSAYRRRPTSGRPLARRVGGRTHPRSAVPLPPRVGEESQPSEQVQTRRCLLRKRLSGESGSELTVEKRVYGRPQRTRQLESMEAAGYEIEKPAEDKKASDTDR
jgi:hypothetical protein